MFSRIMLPGSSGQLRQVTRPSSVGACIHSDLDPAITSIFRAELQALTLSYPHEHLGVDELPGETVTLQPFPQLTGFKSARELRVVGVESQDQAVLSLWQLVQVCFQGPGPFSKSPLA